MKEGLQIVSGVIDLIAAATNRSKSEVTEELIADLQELLANPPKDFKVDADNMKAAFERGRASREEQDE